MKTVKNYNGRTQIFYSMLDLLSDYKIHNAKEISERLEIGIRSVNRYIEALEQNGYQIDHIIGRGGGVILLENNAAKFSVLTNSQKQKLITLLKNDESTESHEILTILNLI